NSKATIENYTISINRWGMRDRDYALEKAPGTYRIALLGGSYEMGSGVNDGETYEQLVEDLLNNQLPENSEIKRIEILNFAVPGYHALQHVWLCEHEVFRFSPDMILYAAHSEDPRRLNGFFASLISNGVPLEYEFLKDIKSRSGAAQGQSRDEIRNRLQPWSAQVLSWSCMQIVQQSKKHNARAVWFYLPATADSVNTAERNKMMKQASDAGFETFVLENPYGNEPRNLLQIGNGDTHPNAAGHKRIAETLYPQLSEILGKNISVKTQTK
ncbi:MAG: SGNH/GDSL hydrolase family protein, partial [Bacteroidia bacterium]